MKYLKNNIENLDIKENSEQGVYNAIVEYQSAFNFVESDEEAIEYMGDDCSIEDLSENKILDFDLPVSVGNVMSNYTIRVYELYVDSGSSDYVYKPSVSLIDELITN